MKKTLAVILLLAAAFWPLACGKNLDTSAPLPVVIVQPTNTPSFTGWDIAGPATLTTGQYNYGYVHVLGSGTLFINGAVTLNISNYFLMDSGSGGGVNGIGLGYGSCQGPGSPSSCSGNNSGGSHAGQGASVGFSAGVTNDNPLMPSLMGSGGGYNPGGSGGALLFINASNSGVTINGGIYMDGASGSAGGSGGGAGGTIFIKADHIYGTGAMEAKGAGGQNNGGGGGGGIILLSVHSGDFYTGSISVGGGPGNGSGGPGGTGVYNVGNY